MSHDFDRHETISDDPALQQIHEQLQGFGAQWRAEPLAIEHALHHLVRVGSQQRPTSQVAPTISIRERESSMPTKIPTNPTRSPAMIFGTVFVTLSIILLSVLVFGALRSQRAGIGHTGQQTATPTLPPPQFPLPPGTPFQFQMISASEGWALIGTGSDATRVEHIVHLHAGHWDTELSIPEQSSESLMAFSMGSANDGWALSQKNSDPTRQVYSLYHYTGGTWVKMPAPRSASTTAPIYDDLRMVSATEGWLTGEDSLTAPSPAFAIESQSQRKLSVPTGSCRCPGRSLLWHYQNGTWQEVSSAERQLHLAASDVVIVPATGMVAGDEGWGAINNELQLQQPAVMYHYQHGTWSKVDLGFAGNIIAISMYAANDGWALAEGETYTRASGGQLAVFHYSGTQWSRVVVPHIPSQTNGTIAATGPGEMWMPVQSSSSPNQPLQLWHIHNNAVETVAVPSGFTDITDITRDPAGNLWAIAGKITSSPSSPITFALLLYHNGQWSVYGS